MSADNEVQIQKEPVRGRNDSAMKMFAGLALGEILTVLGAFILTLFITRTGVTAFGVLFALYAYFRYVKVAVPDNFFKNALRYYTRKHYVYRAGGIDYEWRPPIKPK